MPIHADYLLTLASHAQLALPGLPCTSLYMATNWSWEEAHGYPCPYSAWEVSVTISTCVFHSVEFVVLSQVTVANLCKFTPVLCMYSHTFTTKLTVRVKASDPSSLAYVQ